MRKNFNLLTLLALFNTGIVFANCPTIDHIYCNRQFNGLACGADFPGWLGYIDPDSGPDTRGDSKVVYYDNRALWVNLKRTQNNMDLGQIYCYYRGDKGSVIRMGAGNFGSIAKPTGNLWHKGDIIWVNGKEHYSTQACVGSINNCQFIYNG